MIEFTPEETAMLIQLIQTAQVAANKTSTAEAFFRLADIRNKLERDARKKVYGLSGSVTL